MNEQTDLLARVRVASPCGVSWEGMEGDARMRFCRECNLNVYNLSEMTGAEAASLVAATEGRLCARFYRRADGTVLTRDCPTGLRAARLRVSRAGVAAFAALLSLFGVASGKGGQNSSCPAGGGFKVEKTTNANSYSTISGVVTDSTCAPVGGAEVVLTNRETGRKFTARASDKGEFLFAAVPPGTYSLEINADGFFRFLREDLRVGAGASARVGASLDFEPLMGGVVVTETPKPDIESRDGVTVFRGKAITSLPH
ncbi:MAG TPA: carboxypeptidase-like regulatory domain-containing protein [Pyrinomonadaceae bacterium]|nr:carboxypeptidase-like regulatory domain-containing protein [Pyrinomonadaceae bacterium]